MWAVSVGPTGTMDRWPVWPIQTLGRSYYPIEEVGLMPIETHAWPLTKAGMQVSVGLPTVQVSGGLATGGPSTTSPSGLHAFKYLHAM